MTFYLLQAALEVCKAFLQEEEGKGVIMVTDPPFGGLVEPLAVTFKKLIAMWKEGQSQGAFFFFFLITAKGVSVYVSASCQH